MRPALPTVLLFETDIRPVARLLYWEVRSKEEADQTRPEEQVSREGLGCHERFEKHGYFSKIGTSKLIIFGKEITLLLTVRWWVCTIASEESLFSCREYYFLATENSRYFTLCSKTKGYSKNEQCLSSSPSSKKAGSSMSKLEHLSQPPLSTGGGYPFTLLVKFKL